MAGPLAGIRVLDWTQWQMGPVATSMLADLGAEVIKIEHRTSGDGGRWLWIKGPTELPHGTSAYFEVNNRGKKSLALDITKEKGKAVIYRLVKKCDVFVHNVRPGVPERQKLDYNTLCQYNPRLIYVAASGFGPKGPEAGEPAFDPLGQARSGLSDLVNPESPPTQVDRGAATADQIGAIMTAYGVLAALVARERFGVGQRVDVSHLSSMITLLGAAIGRMLLLGEPPAKRDRSLMRNSPSWLGWPSRAAGRCSRRRSERWVKKQRASR